MFVSLKFLSCMRQIFASFGCRDAVDAADDVAVEGEDTRALEEVFERGRRGFGREARCGSGGVRG